MQVTSNIWRRKLLLFFCVIMSVFKVNEASDSRVVSTLQGSVRGYRAPEGGLYEFYGIPYATAPTGANKFKAPLPGPLWLETLDAVDKGIICPQLNSPFVKTMTIQEDCLVANVFVPDTDEKSLPVIVYVHGGAFQVGFGNLMAPRKLVKEKQVIVVNFNYRLGVHGFLCLGTSDIPGNAGMKDQVAALRWVKRNIASFGGNPNDITIAGYSAGSHSVDLLMISKSARGLFNKVIAESGANLGPAFVVDPLKNAKKFANTMGFANVDNVYELEEFFKSASLESLTGGPLKDQFDSSIPFAPCLERNTGEVEFITENPANILKNGKYEKVPMLYGFANMEGMLRLMNFKAWKDKMNEKFSDFLPGDLTFENEEQKEAIAAKVKQFYFGEKAIDENTIFEFINYFGDILFAYPMLRAVKLHVEAGHDQIYLYKYDYVDKYSEAIPTTDIRGAGHCAETSAVLDGKSFFDHDESDISEELKKMKNVMRDFWSNFAKTGKPVPEGSSLPAWPPVSVGRTPYMSLALPPTLKQDDPLSGRTAFWDEIYEKYYCAPSPPPAPPAKR